MAWCGPPGVNRWTAGDIDDMERERPLDPPHKGLRHQISRLVLLAGATDPARDEDLADLSREADLTFALLADHVIHEDQHLFPALEARMPGATSAIEAEHPALEARVDSLHARLKQVSEGISPDDLHVLYLDLADFQADYLLHLGREEREIEPLLLQMLTDDELAAIQVEISASMDPALLMSWFAACAPARNDSDNALVLQRMRDALPPAAFDAVSQTLRQALTPERYARLMAAVAST